MAVELYIIYSVVLAALVLGTFTDFKVREVPDWVSYGMVFAGLGLRSIFSLATWTWTPFLEGLIGFGIFFALALIMFYAGQWGGGDSKMLMGMGALIGIQLDIDTFLFGFIVNTILFGALFGIGYSITLAIRHKHVFAKKASEVYTRKHNQRYLYWAGSAFMLAIAFIMPEIRIAAVMFAALIFSTFYLIVFIKGVEDACMVKDVPPERLTEGDWIVNDVVIDGKRICGPKDLGIERSQIDELIKLKKKRKIRLITIKEGIPFVPSFLIGFLVTLGWGNFMLDMLLSIA